MGKYYTNARMWIYTPTYTSIKNPDIHTLKLLGNIVQRHIKTGVVIWYLDCDTVTWYHNDTKKIIYFYKSSSFLFYLGTLLPSISKGAILIKEIT